MKLSALLATAAVSVLIAAAAQTSQKQAGQNQPTGQVQETPPKAEPAKSPAAADAQKNSRMERGRQFLGLGPAPDMEAAARGQKLFVANCAFCHGQNATGAEGPNLVRSTLVLHDEKGELIGPFLLKGRPDKGMPAFPSLTSAQTYDIAEFLHSRVEAATNRFGYKIQNVVTGNAEAGKAFFDAHCTNCHSATGDLAHIGSKVEPADLQALFLYPSETVNAKGEKTALPVQVTVTLPSGQSESGVLKRIDDFNVSFIGPDGQFHSYPRSEVKVDVKDPLAGHRELLSQYTDADMHNVLAYLVTLK
jgi:mono/diheme cytochrome c family protein